MYREAYKICEEPDIMKAYLYCCYRGYSPEKYVKMLSGNSAYLAMDAVVKEEIKKARREIDLDPPDTEYERWKHEYRRIGKR